MNARKYPRIGVGVRVVSSLCLVTSLLISASASGQSNRMDRTAAMKKFLEASGKLSPNARKHLSSGLQKYLRAASQTVNGSTAAFASTRASNAAAVRNNSGLMMTPGPGGTIRVSNPTLDSPMQGYTQNTTSSAWCGNGVVIGYEDSGALLRTDPANTFGVPNSGNGVSISSDGGKSFADLGYLTPGTFSANSLIGDPSVTCTSATHFQYASLLNTTDAQGFSFFIGPSVSFSTNGGKSWSEPMLAAVLDGSTELADKPWMAVDPTNAQRMYISYTHINFLACNSIELVSSSNGGKTWGAPTVIDSECPPPDGSVPNMVNGSNVVVSPGGKVYVAYEFFPELPQWEPVVKNAIYFARSTDDGKSFSKPFKVADVVSGGDGITLNGNVAVDEYPQMAVDRTAGHTKGTIYITWPDARKVVADANSISGTYGFTDVVVAKSANFGESFKVLGAVSATPRGFSGAGRDQFLPGVAVDKDGEVAVCYYDRRNDPRNLRVDRYCSVSPNGGRNWKDLRISNVNWVPGLDADPLDPHPGDGVGEYDGLTSDFLRQGDGFFGAFEIEIGGNPDIVAKRF